MNSLKRKLDVAMNYLQELTKVPKWAIVESKLYRVCEKHIEEQDSRARLNGELPTIVGFEERTRRLEFTTVARVHTIPARHTNVYMLAVQAYTEPTKLFDGKRFRVHY